MLEKRKKILHIRVTDSEYQKLLKRSELAGMNLSRFMREAGLNNEVKKEEFSIEKKALFLELCRVGNNLNQLTKYTHQMRRNQRKELNTLIEELQIILKSLHAG